MPNDYDSQVPAGILARPLLDSPREARRQKLSALTGTGPVLAGLYARAVELLETSETACDLVLLAHCMREILNRLPDLIGDRIEGHQQESADAASALVAAWDLGELPPSFSVPAGAEQLPVPTTVYKGAEEVVRAQRAGQGAKQRKAEILATGVSPPADHPVVRSPGGRAVADIQEFFTSYAHVSATSRPAPHIEVVRRNFERVEIMLDRVVRQFWPRHDAVSAVLARANRRAATPAAPVEATP